jgi:hypothetical protein
MSEDGEEIQPTLGASAVEAYVSSLMSLWKDQYALRTNPNPPLRNEALKQLLKTRRMDEHNRKHKEFVD